MPNETIIDQDDYVTLPAQTPNQADEILLSWDQFAEESNVDMRAYRLPNGQNKKEQFLFSFAPDQYEPGELLEKLQGDFGGGDYRIRAYKGNKMLMNKATSIAEPKIKPENEVKDLIGELMESKKGDNTDLMAMMMQQQQQSMNMFMQMQQQQQQSQMQLLTAILPAMMGGKQETSPVELMAAMGSQMQALAGLQDKGDPLEKAASLVALMKEVGGGESSGDESWAGLVKSIAPGLLSLGKSESERLRERPAQKPIQKQPPRNRPELENVPPPQTEMVPNPQVSEEQKAMQALIKEKLKLIASFAESDMEADAAATMIDQALPDDQFDLVADFLESPEAVDFMLMIEPRLVMHREWLVNVRQNLLDYWTQSENDGIQNEPPSANQNPSGEADECSERETGHESDTSNNAQSGETFENEPRD